VSVFPRLSGFPAAGNGVDVEAAAAAGFLDWPEIRNNIEYQALGIHDAAKWIICCRYTNSLQRMPNISAGKNILNINGLFELQRQSRNAQLALM